MDKYKDGQTKMLAVRKKSESLKSLKSNVSDRVKSFRKEKKDWLRPTY